jgi:hypothetical protein
MLKTGMYIYSRTLHNYAPAWLVLLLRKLLLHKHLRDCRLLSDLHRDGGLV